MVGIDEAGRGPLAGPVIAVAVVIKIPNPKLQAPNKLQFSKFKTSPSSILPAEPWRSGGGKWGRKFLLNGVDDSKKLSPKKREEIYKIITNNPNVGWGIGRVSEKVIDKINILEATKLAMLKAVNNLESKLKKEKKSRKSSSLISYDRGNLTTTSEALKKMFLIIDGNFKIYSDIPQKSIIKGDQKVFSIAAASIIAKVYRDKIMRRYHKKYPQYGFDIHKGYPTKSHCKALEKYGPCEIHRKTFYPVKKYCQDSGNLNT